MLHETQRHHMLRCPSGPVDMVLDTDAYNEIDDQFAIAYTLRSPDRLRLMALYAAPFHNERSTGPADGMEKSYREIENLLTLAGQQVPVLRGAPAYLPGEDTPVISPAAEHLCQLAEGYTAEKPLYVVAIGAITNIASALLISPAIAERMVVVWLGGNAIEWPDNREFNLLQDVAAARVVFASGVPLVLLPCAGVVSAFTTTGPELSHWLGGQNPLCDYLVRHTTEAANEYAKGKVWSRVIWDVTAVGWLMNQEDRFMTGKLIPTPIPEYDLHYAQDHRRPLCHYVYHIHRDALMGDLFARLSQP